MKLQYINKPPFDFISFGLIVIESPESAVEAADFFDSDASSVDALQDGKYQYL